MTPPSHRRRALKIAAVTAVALSLVVAWLWWITLYDRKLQKPSDLIEDFLFAVQIRDYAEAKTFFSSHQLKNIAAWEGSFEHWCDQFAGYKNLEVDRTGPGKSGHYWTDLSAESPNGHRLVVKRIYAKRFDGVWSLTYGLNYETWLALNSGAAPDRDENSQPTGTPPTPDP
ncbi:MAG: hypothetical protein EOP84_04160 [Verrucomicrobiaceae bacterium]|nr:MAG: hypothetical protein EOP84_04160 [Verrucomicrobiaceae bacterium]